MTFPTKSHVGVTAGNSWSRAIGTLPGQTSCYRALEEGEGTQGKEPYAPHVSAPEKNHHWSVAPAGPSGALQHRTEVNSGVMLTSHLPCAGPSLRILRVLARFFFVMTQRGEYDHCPPFRRLGLKLRQPGS